MELPAGYCRSYKYFGKMTESSRQLLGSCVASDQAEAILENKGQASDELARWIPGQLLLTENMSF